MNIARREHYSVGHLQYRRGDPYHCSAKAPVLEGSGSHRLYRRKDTSVDRFVARADLGFFYYSSKRIRGGSTYAECNSGPLKQHLHTESTTTLSHCYAWVYNISRAAGQTKHKMCIDLDGGRHAGREGAGKEQGRMEGGSKGRMGREGANKGREGGIEGREEAMMLGRERASVEEGRVEGVG